MKAIGIILAGGNNSRMQELSNKLSLIHIFVLPWVPATAMELR